MCINIVMTTTSSWTRTETTCRPTLQIISEFKLEPCVSTASWPQLQEWRPLVDLPLQWQQQCSLIPRLSFPNGKESLVTLGGIKPWTSGNIIVRVTKEDTPLPEVIFMWLPRATSTYIQWWRLHCMHWLCWHASKFVEVGEYLLAGKFGQILLRDGQSRKMRQSLSDSVPQANDCEQYFSLFFCSTALPHTRQQRLTMVRADTLLDSTVIMAFSHNHIEGAWQRRMQL